jgi:hypothetical protein
MLGADAVRGKQFRVQPLGCGFMANEKHQPKFELACTKGLIHS